MLSSLTTLPSGVLVAPIQANYASLLALANQLVSSVLRFTLAPVSHLFKRIPAMSQWAVVDSAVHSLPSE